MGGKKETKSASYDAQAVLGSPGETCELVRDASGVFYVRCTEEADARLLFDQLVRDGALTVKLEPKKEAR